MLVLSDAIKLDLSFRETYLVPLIVIDAERDENGNFINEPIYISTNKGVFGGDIFWEDYDLKLNNVKESLDLVGRKYKINNLSFTLSNYFVQEKRISDFVADRGLLNKTVEVYYKTQSCKNLDDCVLIFRGNIRRFDHDSKIVRVDLEDLTEEKLSKELPIANTGFGGNLLNKDDRNKPIPMVYGTVEKAPALPLINTQSQNDETDIEIICDDVNSGRGIEMGGFFTDQHAQNLSVDTAPLYIYKDNYFLVLKDYNREASYEIGDGEFFYDDYEQYTVEDNKLKIRKKYNRNRGLNPPAMNELQTVVRRYPNSMKMLIDPSYGELESDAWLDTVGYGVHFLNFPVKSPELAFDNQEATLLSNELTYVSNINENDYKETFALIPDYEMETSYEGTQLVSDFRPHHEFFSNTEGDSYQYQVMNWFHRYAHIHNQDYANPTVTYIRMPNQHAVKAYAGRKIWEKLIALGEVEYTDISEVPQTLWDNVFHNNMYDRLNSYSSISPIQTALWANKSGLTIPQEAFDLNDSTQLFKEHGTDSANSFESACQTDQWERTQGQKVNYPQGMWYQFRLIEEYAVLLGKNYVCVSLNNDSIEHGSFVTANQSNGSQGNYFYYNFFDIGDEFEFLFNADDFPQYHPIQRTDSGDGIEGYGRSMYIYYTALWNGISTGNAPDVGITAGCNLGNKKYFGSYGFQRGNHGVREEDQGALAYTYTTSHTTLQADGFGGFDMVTVEQEHSVPMHETGWCLWVKNTIESDIGTEQTPNRANEYNLYEPANVKVPANTLMPLRHYCKPKSSNADGAGYVGGRKFYKGAVLPFDAQQITLFSDSALSNRLGCVFVFNDIDIQDDIKCDTFFEGKIKVRFNEETSNDSNKNFLLGLGAVDIDEDEEFNWSSYDTAFDTDNVPLINLSLNECINTTESMVEFNSDRHPDSMQEGHSNQFSGVPTEYIIPEFWKANNFNCLSMIYKLDKNGSDDSFAKMFTQIYNVSILQYIVFGKALDSNLYVNAFGRVNTLDDVVDTPEGLMFKYTGQLVSPVEEYDSQEDYDNQVSFIQSPFSIIHHILEKEVGIENPIEIDENESVQASEMSLAFSINKKIKAKKLINDLCTNTNIFPMFKSTSKFSFTSIRSSYTEDDVHATILSSEIVKSSFTRTPLEKVYTLANVKYMKDYESGGYLKETGYIDGYDCYGNGDNFTRVNTGALGYSYDFLALDREDNVYNFEAEFIRNQVDAEKLRDFLYMYNCNQHNIFKLTLPLKYLYLEVGDIVRFDSLIENMLAYGEDYTKIQVRNAQVIYPYFIVDSINKKQKSIDLQVTQLHNLQRRFTPFVGSISRSFGLFDGNSTGAGYDMEDWELLNNYLNGQELYFTNEQKRVSDTSPVPSGDGYLDDDDLATLMCMINGFEISDVIEGATGDLNQDSVVNIIDIVGLTSLITGFNAPTPEELTYADMNNDGILNVIDIVEIVSQIIGSSNNEEGGDY